MDNKTEKNIEALNFLFNDKVGKKVLIVGGIVAGLYASTYLMRGASRFICSLKELKQAIKN